MSSNARPGIGAVLKRWNTDGTTGAWQQVAEVTNADLGGISRAVIETFPLETADKYVAKKQGPLNSGQITCDINYLRDQFIQLKQDAEQSGTIQYQIVLPNGEGIEFDAFITQLPLEISSDAVMNSSVVFEVDGKIDWASTATP